MADIIFDIIDRISGSLIPVQIIGAMDITWAFFDHSGIIVPGHSRSFCVSHERSITVPICCCYSNQVVLLIHSPSMSIRMINVLECK